MARLLFVLGGAMDVGGAENQLALLAPELAGRGYEVAVLCLWRRGSQAGRLEEQGVAVHALSRRLGYLRGPFAKLARFIGGLYTVAHHIRTFQPDIVHFLLPHAYLVGGLATLRFPAVHQVMSRRGMNRYLRGRPVTRWIEGRLHQRMDALLGNAQRVAAELVAEGAPADRVGVIYNGFDATRFSGLPVGTQARRQLGLPADALVLVKVANLWPYKGHADLLTALAAAGLDGDWRLLLLGRDEGAEKALRRQAADLGLERHVLFLGPRDDVGPILAAADVGVCASHEEGFSNAVLEYLAAGLPCLVTDVGGNREAIGDAGLVVPASHPDALRDAVRTLADADNRARYAAKAAEQVARFSMQRCIDAHDALYQSLRDHNGLPRSVRALAATTAE